MNTAKLLNQEAGWSTLERPRYSPGLLLEDTDLTAGVDYTREMSRLLFRSLFGCGVICGLEVKATLTCKRRVLTVEVGGGVALDGSGNPLYVPKSLSVDYNPVADCEEMPPVVWVVICYKEKACRPKDVSCSGDGDERTEHTRSRDGFVIKLYDSLPDCACACVEPEAGTPVRRLGRCCQDAVEKAAGETSARTAAVLAGTVRDRATRDRLMEAISAGSAPMATMPTPATMATTTPAADPSKDARCACYEDHNAGRCVADCGCSCVVLARIDTKGPDDKKLDDVPVKADEGVHRMIRPILTGYLDCLKPAPPEPEPEPEPTPLSVKCQVDPTSIMGGQVAKVQATVSGADPTSVSYVWSADAGKITDTGASGTFDSTGIVLPTPVTITVRVSDGAGRSAQSSCNVFVDNIT